MTIGMIGLVSALPMGAQAATKVVDAGVPMKDHKAFWNRGGIANAFFPSRLTIRVGDAVRFRPSGYHSVRVLARGSRATSATPPLIVSGEKIGALRDAAGSAWWFAGRPAIWAAAALPPRNWGRTVSFSGRRSVRSGYVLGSRKGFVVRFTRTGTFTFIDEYHRGMKGTVRVVSRSRPVPSARADAVRVRAQLKRARGVLEGLKGVRPPAGVAWIGAAGAGGVEFYDFFPKTLTLPVGGTLIFQLSPRSMETHVVATGPGDTQTEPSSYLGAIARTFENKVIDPAAYYGSEPPGTVAGLTPTLHGNGFWSSGALDNAASTPDLPSSRTVRFDQAGVYTFSCLIHKFEHMTVYVG